MFERFEEEVKSCLKSVLDVDFTLEEPKEKFGDLSTNVAFKLAKSLKRKPVEIAEEILNKINIRKYKYIHKIENINGYINFHIDYNKFAKDLILEVKNKGKLFGSGLKTRKRVVIEHTSANPDGPLHVGHLRNAIIGDSLARLLRFNGYEVETHYYVNDMGRQVAILLFGLKKFPLDKKKKNDHAIADVYVKANKYLEENSEAEKEVREIMKKYEKGIFKTEVRNIVEYCLKGIRETLSRLNIKHDKFIYESDFVFNGEVENVLNRLKRTRFYKENEVSYLDLKEFGIDKELILKRSDGTTLYTTRDIAYHVFKSRNFDIIIDIFGSDHKLVARQLKAVLKILQEKEPEFIIHEFISIPEGKISTRRGIYISVDTLIEECIKKAYEEVSKRRKDLPEEKKRIISEKLGIGSLKFYIVRVSPERKITFKWDEVLNFERNSLPYIQYAYARICKVLKKKPAPENFEIYNVTQNEKNLIKTVSKFPKIVKEAAEKRSVHMIANYLLQLADIFHRFYNSERIIGSKEEAFRLNLINVTKIVLENSFKILGIEPLEEI